MNNKDRQESLTLEILQTIEQQNDVTQRHLADRLDVALGLANSYLKRCVRKGWVKIHQVPANRYLYFLTPKGFAEKSRLTAEYLRSSFDFYRRAGNSFANLYEQCRKRGFQRLLFCGVSELAEIGSLRAIEHRLVIVGTYDPDTKLERFLDLPVWHSLSDTDEYDACLLTALNDTNDLYGSLLQQINIDKILVPEILGISSSNTVSTE